MLTAYDKDEDGKLSPDEQNKFLDDIQKMYNIELPEEFQWPSADQDDEEEGSQQQDLEDVEEIRAALGGRCLLILPFQLRLCTGLTAGG